MASRAASSVELCRLHRAGGDVRIRVTNFENTRAVDVRLFAVRSGVTSATTKGVRIFPEELDAVIVALTQAKAELAAGERQPVATSEGAPSDSVGDDAGETDSDEERDPWGLAP